MIKVILVTILLTMSLFVASCGKKGDLSEPSYPKTEKKS